MDLTGILLAEFEGLLDARGGKYRVTPGLQKRGT